MLTSQQVVAAYGTRIVPSAAKVGQCFLIRFAPDSATAVTRVGRQELERHLQRVYLGSRDPIYHNWHQYIAVNQARIDNNIRSVSEALSETAEIYDFCWAPSAVSLMKQIPALAAAHSHLKTILF